MMIHQRQYMRLPGWDYSSPGGYFVTICVKNKECFLADLSNRDIIPNEFGNIIESRWRWLKEQYPRIELDEFVVMPNHVHGLIWLKEDPIRKASTESVVTGRDLSRKGSDRRTNNDSVVTGRDLSLQTPRKSKSLSDIIGAFKTTSSKHIHLAGFINFFWQRSFFEKIIRSEAEANKIRKYIRDNPKNWADDEENPSRIRSDRSRPVTTDGGKSLQDP